MRLCDDLLVLIAGIVLGAIAVWMLGSVLLGVVIGRGIELAEVHAARATAARRIDVSGLSTAA